MINNFSFADGLLVSAFSMLVVFAVLIILVFVIQLFSKIVMSLEKEEVVEEPTVLEDDSEELLVAQIIISCLVQSEHAENVRIKSIRRIN